MHTIFSLTTLNKSYKFRTIVILILIVLFNQVTHAQYSGFITNSGSNTLTIFDPVTGSLYGIIQTGNKPHHVCVNEARHEAYVLNMGTGIEPGNTIDVFDTRTLTKLRTIELGSDKGPHAGVLSSDGNLLWVACALRIVEVDLDKNSIVKGWNVQQPGGYNFTATKDDRFLYVPNLDKNTVSIIDRNNGKSNIVMIAGQPLGIDISPDSQEAWVTSNYTNTITVINTGTQKITHQFPSGSAAPVQVKFTNDNSNALVIHGDGKRLIVFDAKTKQNVWELTIDGDYPQGLAISNDDRFALIGLAKGKEVLTIDLKNKKIIKRMNTGNSPQTPVVFNSPLNRPYRVAYTIPQYDIVPEGLAYDTLKKEFFISSTYRRKIIRLRSDGSYEDFIKQKQDNIYGVVAINVDHRSRVLWAASGTAAIHMPSINEDTITDTGNSAIHKFDLTTGKLIKKYVLRKKPGENYFLNDLTIDNSGRLYISESQNGFIYTIDPKKDELELWLVLNNSAHPNGLDITPDQKYLFVSLYASPKDFFGRIDIQTKKARYNSTAR